uniref:Uncharacterized protein n=1 Tax=Anser cygnoides TaxID=8845 RepID=A0A8B9IPU9_ANSCY
MKEEYEHNVTFHSVLHSEQPSRDDRSATGPNTAYGLGARSSPPKEGGESVSKGRKQLPPQCREAID